VNLRFLEAAGVRGEKPLSSGFGETGAVQRKTGKIFLSEIVRERTENPFFASKALHERMHRCTSDRTKP